MKWERIVHSQRELDEVIEHMRNWQIKQPCLLTIKPKKRDRTDAQNAIFAVWARQRSEQTGSTEIEERRYCKLTFGIPIMCHHDDFALRWRSMTENMQPIMAKDGSLVSVYEQQLLAMDIIDVTSLMSVDEMTRFLTELEVETYSQGLHLTKPREYNEAMQ